MNTVPECVPNIKYDRHAEDENKGFGTKAYFRREMRAVLYEMWSKVRIKNGIWFVNPFRILSSSSRCFTSPVAVGDAASTRHLAGGPTLPSC